jgi:hypothetical protein
MEKEITKINICFSRHNRGWEKYGCMFQRDIMDKFSSRWQMKLKTCPKYTSGNFILLKIWMNSTKQFNKNPKNLRKEFWYDLKRTCKRNKIRYTESRL